jgi:1-acyl-sn-glycerol-3-phosphate acyltransferase
MRAKIHHFVPTRGKVLENKKDIKEVKEEVRAIILNQLLSFKS